MAEIMKGYKGFDKDMKCRDFQFEEGKEYEHNGTPSLCSEGFHFCENPMDVLAYYNEGNFAEIEAEGVSYKTEKQDTKRVAKKIKIKAKVSLGGLIKAAVTYMQDSAEVKTSGDSANNASSGHSANNASSGDYAKNASSGHSANNASSGYSANNASSGHSAKNASSGYSANNASSGHSANNASSGYYANNASSGDYANNASSGDSAKNASKGKFSHCVSAGNNSTNEVEGENSIAAGIGRNSQCKGKIGTWIVLSEINRDGTILAIESAKVDGKEIKEDTYYKLIGGKFIAQ